MVVVVVVVGVATQIVCQAPGGSSPALPVLPQVGGLRGPALMTGTQLCRDAIEKTYIDRKPVFASV